MLKYILAVTIGMLVLVGCASKSTIVTKPDFKPIVLFTDNSDPAPQSLIDHIIKRTNFFCQQSSKQGVRKVLIEHNISERNTTVIYTCLGTDPSRLTEEVMTNHEVHFISLPLFMELLGG